MERAPQGIAHRTAGLRGGARDLVRSDGGKRRLLDRLRSSRSSILPVPLNSSKITPSILEPRIGEGGGRDGQASRTSPVSGGAEELLRLVQGVGFPHPRGAPCHWQVRSVLAGVPVRVDRTAAERRRH